jgi:hypothetical protein
VIVELGCRNSLSQKFHIEKWQSIKKFRKAATLFLPGVLLTCQRVNSPAAFARLQIPVWKSVGYEIHLVLPNAAIPHARCFFHNPSTTTHAQLFEALQRILAKIHTCTPGGSNKSFCCALALLAFRAQSCRGLFTAECQELKLSRYAKSPSNRKAHEY